MGLRQIRVHGDDILTKTAKPVKEINSQIISLLDDMFETIRAKDAIGLAAPQIGSLKRIVVCEYEEVLYELINPVILESEGTQTCNEACLSVPGRAGDIDRPSRIVVEALNRQGETITLDCDDFLSSVLCHEIDHLDGKVFIDTARNIQFIEQEEIARRKKISNTKKNKK